MRFTSIALLLAGAALTTARGLPRANEMLDVDGGVLRIANCETIPSQPRKARAPKPIASPLASTAADCQARCAAAGSECRSFVFGRTDAKNDDDEEEEDVECLLYAVAVSEIPKQADEALKAYDKACTGVPDEL